MTVRLTTSTQQHKTNAVSVCIYCYMSLKLTGVADDLNHQLHMSESKH